MTAHRLAAVIVLAAGEGTRMRSAVPKALHRVGGRSLLGHALAAARGLDPARLVVVVRHGRDAVAAHVAEIGTDIVIADQDDVPGTGRAAECGLNVLDHDLEGIVAVTMADAPLLSTDTLSRLVATHVEAAAQVTLLSAALDDPSGYGRILRGDDGSVERIVEERDATDEQRRITEVNAGSYVFDASALRSALTGVSTENAQQEKYLTDVVGVVLATGGRVAAHEVDDPWEVAGVNDRVQLARVGRELNRRLLERWMLAGVTVVDPETTWIDVDVSLGRDVTIRPNTQILGASTINDGALIGPDCTLTDVEIGEGAAVVRTQATLAVVGRGASVGPFAHLRPGSELGARSKIGEFVGVKNASIGAGAKVPHLSYVGDADVGEGTNIGAGTIFANYDGVAKHHTTVGAHCRTGANTVFVAPVTIGDGAATGGGAVVRRDVASGALAVSAGTERHVPDWTRRHRPGSPSAAAVDRAEHAADRTAQEHTCETEVAE